MFFILASGTVCYNIVNSRGVRLGNDYYFGPVTTMGPKTDKEKEPEEEPIKKDNNIRLLMEATIRVSVLFNLIECPTFLY